MAKFEFSSAGISAQEIGTIGPVKTQPSGLSAGVIGTSNNGPAFVPFTLGSLADFIDKFGTIDGKKFGPLAVAEWMRNANSITYIRILGAGDGNKRLTSGEVTNAGFTVGEEQPVNSSSLGSNPYANLNGPLGRTYFLGCFMSESAGSVVFSSAGLQGTGSVNGITAGAVPIIRGVLMAPSGVILRLSSSGGGYDSSAPLSNFVADESTAHGTTLGSIALRKDQTPSQEFVLLMNGHKGTTSAPNFITASFDMFSTNYISNVFNLTASLIQEKGHYLAAHWDIYPSHAVVTGTGVVSAGADVASDSNRILDTERSVFLITSSLSRNVGSTTVPNYESFRDRFTHASTPWIISQKLLGKHENLFKLHALDAGANVSNSYKVTIHDVRPKSEGSPYKYGSFSLSVRLIDDPDNEDSKPLETFNDLTLDPSSATYICKVIGDVNVYYDFDRPPDDQRMVIEGNYPLKSRYVRVEVSEEVHNATLNPAAIPMGSRGISHIVTSGSAPLAPLGGSDILPLVDQYYLRNSVVPPLPMRLNNKATGNNTDPPTKKPWGPIFVHSSPFDSNDLPNSNLNKSFNAFALHYPDHSTTTLNFSVRDNEGTPDSTTNGILDADRFCNNLFTLENVKVLTGSSGIIEWGSAEYVRRGFVAVDDDAKTRGINVSDLLLKKNRDYLSFNVMFQGGFDGVNIFDSDEAAINDVAVRGDMEDIARGGLNGPAVVSHRKAIDIIKNTVNADIGVMAIPGIRERVITDVAVQAAEERMDTLYIMDIEQYDSGSNPMSMSALGKANAPSTSLTIAALKERGVNSSYAAAYYPDVIITPDQLPNQEIIVPPSVAVLGAISLNDSVGAPWFAPAGMTRGRLTTALQPVINFDEPTIDNLYINNINPLYATTNIKQLSPAQTSGVVIWGQKTLLLSTESSLNRIAVRRLLIDVRKAVRQIALQFLFEPNVERVSTVFASQITEYLSSVRARNGLQSFKVNIESPLKSRQNVENNLLKGKIYLQPPKTLEFVSLDFIISNGLQSEI